MHMRFCRGDAMLVSCLLLTESYFGSSNDFSRTKAERRLAAKHQGTKLRPGVVVNAIALVVLCLAPILHPDANNYC